MLEDEDLNLTGLAKKTEKNKRKIGRRKEERKKHH